MNDDGTPDKFVFEVRLVSGVWSEIKVDPRLGYQLSPFFPAGHDCHQLNYGQGEGQFSIDGDEWGIYYTARGRESLHLVLHHGSASLDDAVAIVSAICRQLSDARGGEFTFTRVAPTLPDPGSPVAR